MKKMLCPLGVLIALTTVANTPAATLVENGQARAVIVIPAGHKPAAGGDASISPNDGGANKFCCCERCRAWDSPQAQAIYRNNPGIEQARDRCVQQALTAIGAGDPAAAERVRMVATGLEYTRKTRDLLAAAAAVRDGTSDRAEFQKVNADVLAFYGSLALSWAVAIDHNYSFIRRGLGLKPVSP